MDALAPSRPADPRPGIARRLVVWLAGFLVTGELGHGLSERDLRGLDRRYVARGIAGLVGLLAVGYWFAAVVPPAMTAIVVGVPLGFVLVRAVLLWVVVSLVYAVSRVGYLLRTPDGGALRELLPGIDP